MVQGQLHNRDSDIVAEQIDRFDDKECGKAHAKEMGHTLGEHLGCPRHGARYRARRRDPMAVSREG